MRPISRPVVVTLIALAIGTGLAILGYSSSACGGPPCGACDSVNHPLHWHHAGRRSGDCGSCEPCGTMEGTTYWMRSPEQEKRVVMSLYNRYCVRCHGVDGRGVWDIPDVPDFTNAVWQASRTDDQLARLTLEGRGAVMPAFRGTLTLEEGWAMARYLRTLVPGSETAPPKEMSKQTQSGAPPSTSGTKTVVKQSAAASDSHIQTTALKARSQSAK